MISESLEIHVSWGSMPPTLLDGTHTPFQPIYNQPFQQLRMGLVLVYKYLAKYSEFQLSTPRKGCTCVVLPETEEMMVIGGRDENAKYIKTIDIC